MNRGNEETLSGYKSDKVFLVSWGGMKLSPLGTSVTIWPIVPAPMIDNDECGVVGVMIGKGNRSTQENLPQGHFAHHKYHMTWPRLEPASPQWRAGY
jgi:hypothetical protein